MKDPRRYQPHVIYLDRIILPIAEELGRLDDTEYVLNLVKTGLKAVSSCLPFAQAVQFFNALPIPLQALMVEEWKVDHYLPERFTSLNELLQEIVDCEPSLFNEKEGNQQALDLLMAMIGVSSNHITAEALHQLLEVFPQELNERLAAYSVLNNRSSLNECIN